MKNATYIGIDDETGRECWADVAGSVLRWVTVAEHDELIEAGYIDMDGRVLVELDADDE